MARQMMGVVSNDARASQARAAELARAGLDARALTGIAEARSVQLLLVLAADEAEARDLVAAARILGGARPAVAVVMARGDSHDRGAVLEAGADECLTEPVSPRELGARLARLIGARTLADEAARHGAVLARDLAQALRIQQHILPLNPPEIRGLAVVAHYLPAARLGGDFFDIIPLEHDRVAFFIADVAGHGVGAALNTMLIKSQLVIWARPGITVTETLNLLNNYLVPLVDIDYATAVYAVYDRRLRQFEYAIAGHPSPLIIRPADGARPLEVPEPPPAPRTVHCGLPLGLFDDCVYVSNRVSLDPGDRILLYTDGLIEWRDEAGRPLGLDALCSLLGESRRQPLRRQISSLIGHLQARCGGRPLDDDVNLMAFMPE